MAKVSSGINDALLLSLLISMAKSSAGLEAEDSAEERDLEEEENSRTAYVLGVTMLGMLGLQFSVMTLTQSMTPEVREGIWKAISGTISIFLGVVLYSGVNEIFENGLMTNFKDNEKNANKYVGLRWFLYGMYILAWYTAMVTWLSYVAGIGWGKEYRAEIIHKKTGRKKYNSAKANVGELETVIHRGVTGFRNVIFELWRCLHMCVRQARLQADRGIADAPLLDNAPKKQHLYKQLKVKMVAVLCLAHALGFAGIDTFNLMQQQQTTDGNGKRRWYLGFIVIFEAVVFVYLFVRILGVSWRFVMKKFIEAESYKLVHSQTEQLFRRKEEDASEKRISPWVGNKAVTKDELKKALEELEKRRDDNAMVSKLSTYLEQMRKDFGEDNSVVQYIDKKVKRHTDRGLEVVEDHQKFEITPEQLDAHWDGLKKEEALFERRFTANKENVIYSLKREDEEERAEPAGPTLYMSQDGILVEGQDGNVPPRCEFPVPEWWQYSFRVGEWYAVPEFDGLIEAWEDYRIDGENDFFGLVVSFLIVQTLRFSISGDLPEKSEDEHIFEHTVGDAIWLYGFSFGFLSLALWAYPTLRHAKDGGKLRCEQGCLGKVVHWAQSWEAPLLREEFEGTLERVLDIMIDSLMMSSAWSFMYATQWLLAAFMAAGDFKDKPTLWVYLAIAITAILLFVLLIADYVVAEMDNQARRRLVLADTRELEERERTKEKESVEHWSQNFMKARKGIFGYLNTSAGLLVGFSWEANFDTAMEVIAVNFHAPTHVKKFKAGVAIILTFLILPVWISQIIPMAEENGFKVGLIPRHLKRKIQDMIKDVNKHSEYVVHHNDQFRSIRSELDKLQEEARMAEDRKQRTFIRKEAQKKAASSALSNHAH